ncbi:RNA-binding protein lark [Acrasis kona]|uniref:RNA-binding protein lark n=1 Tax=Acrasis kona TaxID=1008807 RepID=A0AAW2ZEL6_9EUKA
MSRELFIGRLPKSIEVATLREMFEKFGTLTRCDVKTSFNGTYGFVAYEDEKNADQAITEYHGKEMDGGKINVEFAKARNERRSRPRYSPYSRRDRSPSPRGRRDDRYSRDRSPRRDRRDRSPRRRSPRRRDSRRNDRRSRSPVRRPRDDSYDRSSSRRDSRRSRSRDRSPVEKKDTKRDLSHSPTRKAVSPSERNDMDDTNGNNEK